jgi:hypothetical protein
LGALGTAQLLGLFTEQVEQRRAELFPREHSRPGDVRGYGGGVYCRSLPFYDFANDPADYGQRPDLDIDPVGINSWC